MSRPTAAAQESPRTITIRGALFALGVLFSMNLLNYVDRYIFAAVGPAIMKDLNLGSGKFGVLASSFMVVYTFVSPVVGYLGDRADRRRLLAFGVGLWSLATVGTAFAANFGQMFVARALLGVGEASYGVVAPALLADLFEPRARARVLGFFYLALPLGTAVGYGLGGVIESHWSWRAAFWVVGLPGLLLAVAGMLLHDPGRGASEGHKGQGPRRGVADYLSLFRTPSFLLNTAGMAAVTFTLGAVGQWVPNFYERVRGMPQRDKLWIGLALAVAGTLGVLIGMWLPDRLLRRTRRAYMLWPAFAVSLSIPFGVAGLLARPNWASIAFLFVASVLATSCLGPCNAVTAAVVPPSRRSAGFALSIFLLHLYGDIPSPPLIGELADWLGRPEARASAIGRSFEALGAVPVPAANGEGLTNLTAGMLLIVPVLALGSLAFWWGSRHLVRDEDRARALGGLDFDDPPALH
ncbi:MAG TPA: MFS transporter [Isosphaeraceae bacterium]|jgi:predicted MFS family arabinose efflux permease|nr:MFS transporter [Isosphaeraceae bacterium]